MFEGSRLVDKLVEKSPGKFSTRDKATELLQVVLKEGIIKSISRSRLFEDGDQLFYWTANLQPPDDMAAMANARTRVTSLFKYEIDIDITRSVIGSRVFGSLKSKVRTSLQDISSSLIRGSI